MDGYGYGLSAHALRRVENVGASLLAIPDLSNREQARSYAAETQAIASLAIST